MGSAWPRRLLAAPPLLLLLLAACLCRLAPARAAFRLGGAGRLRAGRQARVASAASDGMAGAHITQAGTKWRDTAADQAHASDAGADAVFGTAAWGSQADAEVGDHATADPCTMSASGVNATVDPTIRQREAGVLHFDRDAHLLTSEAVGFDPCTTQRYDAVHPEEDSPSYFPDAFALKFLDGVVVGDNWSYSTKLFERHHEYCVAPVQFQNDTYNQTEGFQYWAIGKDCCETVNETIIFTCGNITDPDAHWGLVPTNPLIVDRFQNMIAMAESMLDLPPVTEKKGVKLVYWVSDPDQEPPEWLHIPGLSPPLCSVPLLCISPLVGLPLQVNPFLRELRSPLPGPRYYAVGRGCCSADRHMPGFSCMENPAARSGVVLQKQGLRLEWLPALQKADVIFNLHSNPSTAVLLWWDTPSEAAWQCSRAYHPWLDEATPEVAAPPKFMGCTIATGLPCQYDSDCKNRPNGTGLACHGALRTCVCRDGCWSEQQTCEKWRGRGAGWAKDLNPDAIRKGR